MCIVVSGILGKSGSDVCGSQNTVKCCKGSKQTVSIYHTLPNGHRSPTSPLLQGLINVGLDCILVV